jgi:hypothetical protein
LVCTFINKDLSVYNFARKVCHHQCVLPALVSPTISVSWRHRSTTTSFQALLAKAVFSSSFHVLRVPLISDSISRLQVFLSLPFSRLPCGFQDKAWLVMLSRGLLSVWPIQLHLLYHSSCSTRRCIALCHIYYHWWCYRTIVA